MPAMMSSRPGSRNHRRTLSSGGAIGTQMTGLFTGGSCGGLAAATSPATQPPGLSVVDGQRDYSPPHNANIPLLRDPGPAVGITSEP